MGDNMRTLLRSKISNTNLNNTNKLLAGFLALVLVAGMTSPAFALNVVNEPDAMDLANAVAPGLNIDSATILLGDGAQFGLFTDGMASGLGVEEGIILSTGTATDAEGPNNNGNDLDDLGQDDTTTGFGGPGDTDLDNISGFDTEDAAVLEIVFTLDEPTEISTIYNFGSEEYPFFVGTSFNDVFAFFLDGVNIATVPGTGDDVTINSINSVTNSGFFMTNNNPATEDIEFDGFTIKLVGEGGVLAAGQHTMTFAIADAGDDILDSAVLIMGLGEMCPEGTKGIVPNCVPINDPIGGTVGSMSTTSLLVAGAQDNMGLWSLALVGIVGAAAAITYKVKSKKSEQ